MTAIIQTEKLTKSYGEHRGIVDVDLEVAETEVFGFLGPGARLRDRIHQRPGGDPPPDRLHPG